MKKIKSLALFTLLTLAFMQGKAQYFTIDPIYYTIFDKDSLEGFDEVAARAAAVSEGFLGSEFKIKMYRLKREYIDNKYNLDRSAARKGLLTWNQYLDQNRPAPVPGCVNEDFEESTPSTITASNQVTGWVVTGGYNGSISGSSSSTMAPYYPGGLSNPNSCNLLGCCPLPPAHSAIIDCSAPGGYVDAQIGSQYPLYSVFGTANGNSAAAAAVNPQISSAMTGTTIMRLNDGITGDYSIERISKTFAVTAQNALFQFAFVSVFSPGHGCCDAGGFQIRLSNASANTVIPCPNFSVSAPSSACTATVPVDYFVAGTGAVYNNTTSAGNIYNRWKVNSIDLSAYINQNITIDIIVSDCNAGGHYGKVYLDAQCGPMIINGNGTDFDAGITNVVVPTCGAAGATICAAAGLGPYSWAGPGVTQNQSTPSMTNQCMTSTISATYTLSMMPQGACVPITRVVTSTITPAPLLAASALQATCGNTLAIVSVTPSGSAAQPSSLTWSPTPLSLNTNTTVGTYQIPITTPMIVSVTASDPLGCKVTATTNVNPAPPYPTFTIANLTGPYSITCLNPVINLEAQSYYNYNGGSLNYFWASNSATFATNNVNITVPGVYTVTAIDPVTNCGVTHTVAVGVNTLAPGSTLSPTVQVINCNLTSVTDVTLTSTQTVNVTQNVLSPQGGTFSSTSYSMTYSPGGVGIYTYNLVNDINGCSTTKFFTVTANQGLPTYSVVSASNFTLGCTTKSIGGLNIINASATNSNQIPTGGPVSYTIIGPPTSTITPTGTLSSNSVYSINVPGTWTVIVKDNLSLCESRTPISILSNTFAPDLSVIVPQQVLDCNVPRITLNAESTNTNVAYNWSFPTVPGNQPGDTITVYVNSGAPTNSLIANFTITITDNSSTCKSFSIIPMRQNLYPPKAVISPAINASVTCKTPTVMLTNQSTTGIPPSTGYPTNQAVVGFLWQGPSPQEDANLKTTYLAQTPGTYTMVAKDLNNGCTSFTTTFIEDKRDYPRVSMTKSVTTLDCGASTATITTEVLDPLSDLNFLWTGPAGHAYAGTNTLSTFMPDTAGEYNLYVVNIKNGCVMNFPTTIVNGTVTVDFDADPIQGFAPLTVNLDNNSRSSLDPTSKDAINPLKSIWNFGNGTSQTFSNTVNTSVIYTNPGTYTITLYSSKGPKGATDCRGEKSRVVIVELPSKLIIPNIFTPNNDGVNDLFFLETNNLTKIDAVIMDRWGHLVYELHSATGNIAWDGKNQKGVECAEGVYFYTIKATGLDGENYDKSGNVTLSR